MRRIMDRQTVAQHLRIVRELAGLTPNQAAKRIQTGSSYIYRLEKGLNSPTVDKLSALCKAYGINLAKFFASMRTGNGNGNNRKTA